MAAPRNHPFASANRRRAERQRIRQGEALRLRLQGDSISAIAAKLDIHFVTASRDVNDSIAALVAQNRAENEALRAVELQRLEAVIAGHWARATGTEGEEPDSHSAAIVVRCIAERAKLMGLYLQADAQASPRPLIEVAELRALLEARQRSALERARAAGITIELPPPSGPAPRGNGSLVP